MPHFHFTVVKHYFFWESDLNMTACRRLGRDRAFPSVHWYVLVAGCPCLQKLRTTVRSAVVLSRLLASTSSSSSDEHQLRLRLLSEKEKKAAHTHDDKKTMTRHHNRGEAANTFAMNDDNQTMIKVEDMSSDQMDIPDGSFVGNQGYYMSPAFQTPMYAMQPAVQYALVPVPQAFFMQQQAQQQAFMAQQQQQAMMAQQQAVLAQQQAAMQAAMYQQTFMLQQNPFLAQNSIPAHFQSSHMAQAMSSSLGHQGASVESFAPPLLSFNPDKEEDKSSIPPLPEPPVLTVQDRPMVSPVYNGVNPHYPGLRMINSNPPIFVVDNFLTHYECDFLIHSAQDSWTPAPVVGKGAGELTPSRTSSTCYLAREDLPDYMRKVAHLTGKPIEHFELPQVGRYLPTQEYLQVRRKSGTSMSSIGVDKVHSGGESGANSVDSTLQHFDAFDLGHEDGRRFAANGGQRVVTVLVYLNDVREGGATKFPTLNLEVKPRKGMALVFFPATTDGFLEKMVLHAALPAVDTKFVSQVWIRQSNYKGQPSKRISQPLGVPFDTSQSQNSVQTTNNVRQFR